MLLVDERCLQSDLVGADRIVPVASVAASRDLDASSSTQRCCDLTRATITRLARTSQSTRTRRCREQYMPLVALCPRHFLADSIICMCVFDFRQAHPLKLSDAQSQVIRERSIEW